MTMRQVADRAGVSHPTVARVEVGNPQVGVDTLVAIGEAVGVDVVLRGYPGRTPSLRDTGQLALAEALIGQAHRSWTSEVELAMGPHGEAIDLVLFASQEIIASEIERIAADWQAQYRRSNTKRNALAEQHRRPVRLVMVVEDTRRNRAALSEHAELIRSQLPARSRDVLAALRTGARLGRDGFLWVRRPSRPKSGA
jgi:transcriptional regulator with XRE-family HTH domain